MSANKSFLTRENLAAPILFKDFHKDVKDMLNKNVSGSNVWKVECRHKGPKDVVFVNPQVNDNKVSADIEYVASQCGAGIKVNVSPECEKSKATVTYNHEGHKAELVATGKGTFELSHETTKLFGGLAAINEKVTLNGVEMGLGLPVASHCHVGCGAVYDHNKKFCNWHLGCRYAEKGCIVDVSTNRLATFTTGIRVPNPVDTKCCDAFFGAEVVCTRGKGWDFTVGVESTCTACRKNTVKAKINKNKEWVLSYIVKFADNWTVAVSVDKSLKAGVLFSHA